jgi:hypothetical protein
MPVLSIRILENQQRPSSLHRSQIPTEPVAAGAMQALAAERSGFPVIFAGEKRMERKNLTHR